MFNVPHTSLSLCALAVAGLLLSGCSNGQQVKLADAPIPTSRTLATQADPQPAESPSQAALGENTENSLEQVAEAPQSPVDGEEPMEAPQVAEAAEAPVPVTAPRAETSTVVKAVTVTEKPVRKIETTDIVETPERIIERKETVETTERVVDQVQVDEDAGRVVEQVEVIERTERTVDTIEVDKTTGAAVETIVRSEPVKKEVETMTVVVEAASADDAPRDPARLFTGPEQSTPADYRGYGIVAIRADTPPSERQRLNMICEAFVAPLPARPEGENAGMVTVWPVSSTAHADELNAAPRQRICGDAVERYGLSEGRRAIVDTERTGWILDNRGPYLLAWSPPSAKGTAGALVLLVDLSGVTTPEAAQVVMQRWSSDIERNADLWAGKSWDVDLLRPIIASWREQFGARTLMLLGPVGG
ncbi:hypothetical protein [Nitratireductor sp. XY-223]|uniref:hypothetical protein n=1 Tax=Nitratireductor sp. XY-223 TaxID=2561926 RepID=UPI0010AA712A|nr:hypothetical protein [Nitratireductor sp. XY-223]